MCPTIVTDFVNDTGSDITQKVRLVVGAAGGSRIISSVAFTTILNIIKDWEIDQSIGYTGVKMVIKRILI